MHVDFSGIRARIVGLEDHQVPENKKYYFQNWHLWALGTRWITYVALFNRVVCFSKKVKGYR